MSLIQNKKNYFFPGLFLGGLLGGIIIYLLGTKDGQNKLRKIIENVTQIENGIKNKLVQFKEKKREILINTSNIQEKTSQKIKNSVDNLTASTYQTIDDTLSEIENLQNRGLDTTKNIHKRFFKKLGKKLTS